MDSHGSNWSWMDSLPPRVLFFGGLIGGILVLCTIGFFILLGVVLNGNSDYSADYNGGSGAGAGQPSTPPANPGEPQVQKPAAVGNDEHILGSKSAKVTLIEYSDLQCPFCSRFHPTAEQLANDSGGKVRLVFRHFPLSSIHPLAAKAAETAECVTAVAGQNAFWKYVNGIFANQASMNDSMLLDQAAKAGANRGAVDACVKSGKYAGKVQAMQQEGEKIGVQGTPATFVVAADGSFELMPGALPLESAKAYVDRALAK